MVTAALGGEFEVPTIDGGKSQVKVPEGTQSGSRFRLHGKGMPVLRSKQRGDMYVQVAVETPQKLTKRQRELLNEFEKLSSKETQPETSGFFTRVKEFFDGLAGKDRQSRASTLDPRAARLRVTVIRPGSPARYSRRRCACPQSSWSSRAREKRARLDDEVRFLRSWLQKPLAIGAVTPSGPALARTMAA